MEQQPPERPPEITTGQPKDNPLGAALRWFGGLFTNKEMPPPATPSPLVGPITPDVGGGGDNSISTDVSREAVMASSSIAPTRSPNYEGHEEKDGDDRSSDGREQGRDPDYLDTDHIPGNAFVTEGPHAYQTDRSNWDEDPKDNDSEANGDESSGNGDSNGDGDSGGDGDGGGDGGN